MPILLSEEKNKTKHTTILIKGRAYNVTTVEIIILTGLIPHHSSYSSSFFLFFFLKKHSIWFPSLSLKSSQAVKSECRTHSRSNIIISVTGRQLTSVHIYTSATDFFFFHPKKYVFQRWLHAPNSKFFPTKKFYQARFLCLYPPPKRFG